MYKKSIFIFRRDLRLEDNIGLINALKKSNEVFPVFIYDKNISKRRISQARWKFLNDSLLDLNNQLKKKKSQLNVFKGIPNKVIQKIIKENKIDAVFLNTDFSNYSQSRDEKIHSICKKQGITFSSYLDYLLHNPNEIKTNEGKPYTIYSHFVKKAKKTPVKKILNNLESNYSREAISEYAVENSLQEHVDTAGRTSAIDILKNLKSFKDYYKTRNYPHLNKTTKLSAHNKFGTVSIREVYFAIKESLGSNHMLIGEIYWREFFNHVLYHFPWSANKSFKEKFQNISWSGSKEIFLAWKEGKTGFPIVDAGIKELNQTGFMHNRVRMIVASFLTKDLHVDWRMGERYFAQKLVDYDPAVNVGNWQWAASTGCDAVPYFRIFNPWLQQEKFDPECQYIKKWIPELAELLPSQIHQLWKEFPKKTKYVKPIVDHKIESAKTKEIFKSQK